MKGARILGPARQADDSDASQRVNKAKELESCRNTTKWDELWIAMDGLGVLSPRWRTNNVESGHVSHWNGDWHELFRKGGNDSIGWVEILIESECQREAVLARLREVYVSAVETEDGFRIFARYLGEGVLPQ
ncbi:MAG TPA: hypothetical protein PKE00_01440 [Planctomycetota bacterium]|nr:hypothetical protein [Planctomycetota bacterium]